MANKFNPKHAAEHGYTKEDWDAVSDNPPITKEEMKRAKPFKEALPELYESIQRSRGRPRVASPKEAVTLRLDPDVIQKFKATGKNWRGNMTEALRKAVGL
ncbi:BrnA antitoxin family protein [Brucella anthropi]|uniref:BrnA antitoxin family protein n=1 Tax=Brucella/Ochrobactrum group TaxID=2826938 RepID=UPI00124D9797|nr:MULTISPECIES: BrnA antitoxin family protein [Brucella/Ochrobactrum group]KAB2761730.1 BrnA antitoxin family protein [Brucella anthropi]KAB2777580.1 BrnA antitoxin family protein [Brucella anthropi]MCQ9145122.1 BrnA antitoxin family protein [Ochrobactrum sp. BTU2]UGQ23248.1 BrnA antitoxin family protein [Brucella anthropi]